MPSEYFAVLAQHSAWANQRLYRACEPLSAADYLRERASTFGSLHATLHHIMVVDRTWIARIEGRTPPPLDENQILYPDLIGLKSRMSCRRRAAASPGRRFVRGGAGSTALTIETARRPVRDAAALGARAPVRPACPLPRRGGSAAVAGRDTAASLDLLCFLREAGPRPPASGVFSSAGRFYGEVMTRSWLSPLGLLLLLSLSLAPPGLAAETEKKPAAPKHRRRQNRGAAARRHRRVERLSLQGEIRTGVLPRRRPAEKRTGEIEAQAAGGDGDPSPGGKRRQCRELCRRLSRSKMAATRRSISTARISTCSPKATPPGRAPPISTRRSSRRWQKASRRWSRPPRKKGRRQPTPIRLSGFAQTLALIDKACGIKR